MKQKNKTEKIKQEPKEDLVGISSITNTIKEIALMPAEIGKTMQKEMTEFLKIATYPIRTEFMVKDLLQIIVGAAILAIPVGLTQEAWDLGQKLPIKNVVILMILSIVFIGTFVYYNYYRKNFKKNWDEYAKRVFSTYIFSLAVVAILLEVIEVTPWDIDPILCVKRIVLVAFPASMSAVVADTIK